MPQSLDIILVRGSSSQSTWLCGLQSIVMLQPVSFSHVILSMGEGICLHATTNGVDLIRLREIWTLPIYQKRKIVLRSNKIKTQVSTNDLLEQTYQFARKTFGAQYNHFFGIPKRWIGANTWFCSELAADALGKVGHNVVSNRDPERIWPGHFQHCHRQSDWEDVTHKYDTYVAKVAKGADPLCIDVFASTQHSLDEATFSIHERAFRKMFTVDGLLAGANAFDKKLRETVAETIRATDEIKKRMKK